jgi:hypothetical protein
MFIGIKPMKKLAFATALLGAGLVAQSAQASAYVDYYETNPAKSSLTITLSGACSAKITIPVTQVSYGSRYYDNVVPGTVDTNSSYSYLEVETGDSDISVDAYNYAQSSGEKISHSVKKGKRSLAFNIVGSGYWDVQAEFESLANGTYDSQIKCKDGLSLQDQMVPGWETYYDARGEKAGGSLSHTNIVSEPVAGTYKAKFSSSGTIKMPSQCALKGVLDSTDFSLVCTPAKTIKIKMAFSASGTSSVNW